MGDVIDLHAKVESLLDEHRAADLEALFVTEGLELLADYRDISDPAIRESFRLMVSRVAAAFRGGAWYVSDRCRLTSCKAEACVLLARHGQAAVRLVGRN